MTALIAWVAVDPNGTSSFYLASDSRISWRPGSGRWESGRKLFASRRSPDIFGFCDEVLFPTQVLSQVVDIIDAGALFSPDLAPPHRHRKIAELIRSSHDRRHAIAEGKFSILHAARQFRSNESKFTLWHLSYDPESGWRDVEVPFVPDTSRPVLVLGTGANAFSQKHSRWNSSDVAGTSRAVFGAFCDALKSNEDRFTGGAPQLVGLHRSGNGITFGTIFDQNRYLHGLPLSPSIELASVKWCNELFEFVDAESLRVPVGGQRHARPRQV
jgi:hypothetical protein